MHIDLQDDDAVDVQMSPLIDCVFLLLIFFLVATSLKKIETTVPVDLPDPAVALMAEATPAAAEILRLAVDAEGTVYLRGSPVPQGAWVDALRIAGQGDEESRPPVLVTADRAAPWGAVDAVLTTANFYGLGDVRTQVRDPEADATPPSP